MYKILFVLTGDDSADDIGMCGSNSDRVRRALWSEEKWMVTHMQ